MAHDADASRQLRLLFSWREALLEGSADRTGRVRRLQRVERALDFCRSRHRKRLEHLGAKLRAALQKGEDSAAAAELRGQVEFLNSLLRAQSAEDLGGRIELPVDRYPAELDALGLPWRGGPKLLCFRPMAYLSPSDRKILLALPFCLLLAIMAVLYFMRWRGDVRFELLDGPGIRIQCVNESAEAIQLIAPWPEQRPASDDYRHYGFELFLREEEDGEFRPYPSYGTGWYFQGVSTATIEPIRVAPGLEAEIEFRADEIPLLESMDGFRIEARHDRGRAIARFDFSANGG